MTGEKIIENAAQKYGADYAVDDYKRQRLLMESSDSIHQVILPLLPKFIGEPTGKNIIEYCYMLTTQMLDDKNNIYNYRKIIQDYDLYRQFDNMDDYWEVRYDEGETYLEIDQAPQNANELIFACLYQIKKVEENPTLLFNLRLVVIISIVAAIQAEDYGQDIKQNKEQLKRFLNVLSKIDTGSFYKTAVFLVLGNIQHKLRLRQTEKQVA